MRRSGFVIIAIFALLFLFPKKSVFAACTPPSDYKDCPVGGFGEHIAGNLIGNDKTASIARSNFATIRSQALEADSDTARQQLPVTAIFSPDLIRNPGAMSDVFAAAKEYGIRLTISLEVTRDEAAEVGSKLQNGLSSSGLLNSTNVYINNEGNINGLTGGNYGAILSQFVVGCGECRLFLATLGGPPTSDTRANHTQFTADFARSFPELFDKIKGIAFNTYGAKPEDAVTEWLNALSAWKAAAGSVGKNLDNKIYFLTEVGPPNGDPNWQGDTQGFLVDAARLFAQYAASGDPRFAAFKNIEGLTWFLWEGDGSRMVLMFVDPKTGRRSIAIINVNTGWNLGTAVVYKKNSPVEAYRLFPDESAESCPPEESSGGRSGSPGTFQLFPFLPGEREMRANAGVNLNAGVRATHCGQAKSEPIVLHESTRFPMPNSPFCKTVKWAGNISIKDGVNTPFAQELADQWAGRWDGEHYEESYINDLEEKSRNLTRKYSADVEAAARREIEVNTGVLKKILSKQRIDELTCDTINYVKKKGGRSAFANFTVNGHRLVDIECPPTIILPKPKMQLWEIMQDYNRRWAPKWLDTWLKLPLFPDEQAIGQLRFAVCDDKIYNAYGTFPEVFRLGLATTEIFKAMKPEEDIRKMSKAGYGDILGRPLQSNKLVDNAINSRELAYKATVDIDNPVLPLTYYPPADNHLSVFNIIKQKLIVFWQKVFPFVKPVPPVVAGISDPSPDKLLAAAIPGEGGCFSVGVEYSGETPNADGSVDVNVRPVLTNTVIGEGGGHVQYFVNGVSQGTQIPWNTSPEEGSQQIWLPPVRVRVGAGGTSGITVGAKIDECGKSGNFNQLGCTFSVKDGKPTSTCGQFALSQPQCNPDVQCCPGETRTCAASCANCGRAQLGPSFTSGAFTGSSGQVGIGNPEVAWSFDAPAGNPPDLPPGCEEVEDALGRITYQCRRGHTRVVDVYANVPFLDSIWKQSAGVTSGVEGFFYAFKPFMTVGQSIPTRRGCSGTEEFVFTKDKQFADPPGASEVSYDFSYSSDGRVQVQKISENPEKLLFYKIGGVCNANRWVSTQELMPNKQINPFYRGLIATPTPTP